mmetsp:Transcript_25877/g.74171  ORF Transcript_25877/g.74171 Transcript_25877/m.74171 type:complete len:207 (+) Transcript_25877:1233-1853(+)
MWRSSIRLGSLSYFSTRTITGSRRTAPLKLSSLKVCSGPKRPVDFIHVLATRAPALPYASRQGDTSCAFRPPTPTEATAQAVPGHRRTRPTSSPKVLTGVARSWSCSSRSLPTSFTRRAGSSLRASTRRSGSSRAPGSQRTLALPRKSASSSCVPYFSESTSCTTVQTAPSGHVSSGPATSSGGEPTRVGVLSRMVRHRCCLHHIA